MAPSNQRSVSQLNGNAMGLKRAAGEDEGRPTGKREEPERREEGVLRMKLNGKWLSLSEQFVKSHHGGPVLLQYKDADATHIFHAFHQGSARAYKQLALLEAKGTPAEEEGQEQNSAESSVQSELDRFEEGKVVAEYNVSIERERQIVLQFERLRQQVQVEGLMHARPLFYARKVGEVSLLMALAFWLQFQSMYLVSALTLALCWQQLGWLCHEFCHHQPSKNRRFNDAMSLVLGNAAQGFSRDWWKDKHNLHHAATNIIDRDGDIDLAPLLAMVPNDLARYKAPLEKVLLKLVLPYQHWYFTATYPLLRISWTTQSIVHAMSAPESEYSKHRGLARAEQLSLLFHWSWVLLQLWLLPSWPVRLLYFAVSQLGAGLLIALVVSYNHNSVPKFPAQSRLLNNFAALHLFTTRNMRSSPFVDWFWGGLNYQIEHHLFPTMPRHNLGRCSQLVRHFCARTGLPYMADDFATGYLASLRLLRQVADQAVSNRMEERKAKRG